MKGRCKKQFLFKRKIWRVQQALTFHCVESGVLSDAAKRLFRKNIKCFHWQDSAFHISSRQLHLARNLCHHWQSLLPRATELRIPSPRRPRGALPSIGGWSARRSRIAAREPHWRSRRGRSQSRTLIRPIKAQICSGKDAGRILVRSRNGPLLCSSQLNSAL